jgi:integrase
MEQLKITHCGKIDLLPLVERLVELCQRRTDLRHGHATALLAAGVHPKVASERLGHSRVALTLDTYSHVIPGMQEDAVARIDAVFGSALMNSRA